MKKNVYLDEHAKKTLDKLSQPIQTEFYALFQVLEQTGQLDLPNAKKN